MRDFLPTASELSKLTNFHTRRSEHRVGVYGYGVVGREVVEFLREQAVRFIRVIDGNPNLKHPDIDQVEWCIGELRDAWLSDLDVLFIGPGVDPRQPLLATAREDGLLIIGELALLGNLPAQVIAITGTNGKSTTTAWAGYLLDQLDVPSFIGGNLGDPITGWCRRGYLEGSGVLELSSYQLESAYGFSPRVSLITNLASDHASRYESDAEYFEAKFRVFQYQDSDGICIMRTDVLPKLSGRPQSKLWTFGNEVAGDGFRAHSGAWHGVGLFADTVLDWNQLKIPGAHNAENALCAVLSVWGLRGETDLLTELWSKAAGFSGLEHRLEFIAEVDGVRFYNDSKATNDESAATALEALDGPIVWLAGGVSKQAGYDASMKYLNPKVRCLIAFGRAASEIAQEARVRGYDIDSIIEVSSLGDAITLAAEQAERGVSVLLSPACASFDEFKNFEERGHFFKEKVLELH